MTRAERIDKAIRESGLKKGQIAAACDVTPSSVTQWTNGDTKSIKPENLAALASITGKSMEWLATGKGNENGKRSDSVDFGDYDVLSSAQVLNWQQHLGRSTVNEAISTYSPDGTFFWMKVTDDSMMASNGQSIPEGYLIQVWPHAEPKNGSIVVVVLANSQEAAVKKLVNVAGISYLKPLNSNYRTIEMDEGTSIIGVARRAMIDL